VAEVVDVSDVAEVAGASPSPTPAPGRGWKAKSVRARATIGAVAVVGLALVASSVVLLGVLRFSYVESVRNPARTRAQDIATSLERGAAIDQLELEEGGDRFTQIVEGGEVVAASANASDVGSLASQVGVGVSTPVADVDDRWVVVTADAGRGRTVVVGRELDTPLESIGSAAVALAIGVPLLLGVVGFTTWRVVGAALAPVEAIRSEVSSMGAADLATRVPVPASGDEIEELATTMNQMLDRLEAAQRRQRQFVSDASHELRSPLAAVRQHAEVARAHPDRTSPEELAEVVLAEEARLESLVDDLLLLTRSDEGGLGLHPTSVDLDDLTLEEAHRGPALALAMDTTGVTPVLVDGDEALLRRAVRNLIDNASRHAAKRVEVATRVEHGRAIITVHDDGPGIPAEHREDVFQRFVRLDQARSADEGGAGLGLAIVAEVVAAHGGEVAILTSPLGGAAVRIQLPGGQRPSGDPDAP
jgi:signal transduction histidine kinase